MSVETVREGHRHDAHLCARVDQKLRAGNAIAYMKGGGMHIEDHQR